MPLVVRYLFFAAAILHLLMVVVSGERTALHCTTANYTNATVLIVFAGQYDVSCIGSFEWFVWVIGCASNGTINSRVVSIRLLNSPIQVIISDNTTLLSSSTTAHNATLAGCSVDITYLSDTVVPIASSNVTYPPVYVSSTSFMGNISVVLVATLYLEGAFIFITGNISGGIESVTLRCDQGSSIVCANNSYIICSPIQGTSLIVLAPGCPQIGALSVHLNGTNVTGSMWLRTASTSSASSFSFALVDHYTLASLTPRSTSVVVKDVQGLMVMSTVLAVRTIFPGTPPLFALDGYGVQRVSVIVENSTMTADPSKFDPMFFLKNAVSLQLTLISVSCTGHVLSAVVPETNDSISSEGAMLWPIIIHVVNSSLRTAGKSFFFNIPNTFNGTVLGRSVVSTSAVKSTFVLEGTDAELLQFVAFSSSSTLPPLLFTVSIVLSQCTINTTLNSVRLLYTSSFGQPPILHNSSIVFEDSVVYQTWETFVNFFGTVTPPVPLIQKDLNKTSIVFARCNIFVQQVSSPTTPSVALLLSINNAMTTSSLHFINSSITVAALTATPLRTFPISVNAMSSSNITVTSTTLTNLLALVQLRNISSTLNAIADVGCSNSWCAPADNRPCGPVMLRYVLTTAPPPDVVVAVCSHSLTYSAVQSITGSTTVFTQLCSRSISRSASLPRGTATLASSATVAKTTITVWPSVTKSKTLEVSPSYAMSVSRSAPTEANTNSSSTSLSPGSCTSTGSSELVHAITVNDRIPPAAVQAVAIAVAAPLASVALSMSVAGVLQRNFVALQFSGCASKDTSPEVDAPQHAFAVEELQRGQLMAVSENPTRLSFGRSEGAMYRGAAVGNMILMATTCALIIPLGLCYSLCNKNSDAGSLPCPSIMAASLGKLRLPGRAFLVLAVLLQPTVTAAVGLLMISPPLLASDVVLSVATILVLLLLVVCPAWAVFRGCRLLVIAVDIPHVGGVADFVAGRRVAWIPRPHLPATSSGWILDRSVAGAECFALQFNSFIGRVGSGACRELYFVFGCLWSVVAGVVGALDPNDLTSCYIAQITLVAVPALSLIALLVVRPFVSPFDRSVHSILDLLSLIVAILSCVNEEGAAQWASYAEIAISTGVSAVRILLQYGLTTKESGNSEQGAPLDPKSSSRAHPFRHHHHLRNSRHLCVRDNEHEHLQQHDHLIMSGDASSTRRDHIHEVINGTEFECRTLCLHDNKSVLHPSSLSSSVRGVGENMYHTALRHALHRGSSSLSVSAAPRSSPRVPFVPVAVQQRHLLRLILLVIETKAIEAERIENHFRQKN